jgi:UDP-N-acetylmuramate dehydrogenase
MNLIEILKNISDLEIELDKDLTNKSTMRLRARGDLVTIKSRESLSKVLIALNKDSIPYKVLGWGSNQLLKPTSDKIYLELDFPFDKSLLSKPSGTYVLPASTPLNVLTAHAIKFGLKGFESFTGIPASLGGAVFMNAGTGLGEIGTIVRSVKIMEPSGRERLEKITQDSFSYRKNNFLKSGEVIFEVELSPLGMDPEIGKVIRDYLDYRTRTQPLDAKTCGCAFKNDHEFFRDKTCQAGKFIDLAGLKGFTINGIKVSQKHGNFLENTGNGDYFDVINIMDRVNMEMELYFGIKFNREDEL